MRRVVTELCGMLVEQKEALEELTALSLEKRRAVIKGDSESLEELTRGEMRLISRINSIEKKRLALLPELSKVLGLPCDNLTVGAVAGRAEPEERDELLRLQRELVSLINAQARVNEENQELIMTHIEYNDAMLELMVDSEDPLNNFYNDDGKSSPDKKKSTGFFDGQA